MKPLTRSLLSSLLAFSAPAFMLRAQEPAGDPFVKGSPAAASAAKAKEAESPDCFFVMDVYSLDKTDAAAVLESERGSAARYRRVTDLMNAGKARLEILTALATKSGQRAQSESVDEVRFPSGFSETNHKESVPDATEWSARTLGDIVEMEVVMGPDRRDYDLNLAPSHARLAGFRDVVAKAGESVVTEPQFESQKMTPVVGAVVGEPVYIGTFSPPTPLGIANGGAASPVWLAFVHVNVLKPSPEAAKTPVRPLDWTSMNLEYTCYSLDRALAREILVTPGAPEAPWEKVQALLGKKEARFEDMLTLKTRSGQRAATDATQEMRYAAVSSTDPSRASDQNNRRATTAPSKEGEKSAAVTGTAGANRTEPDSKLTPGASVNTEVRNLGVSIECEPVVRRDEVTVDINHVVQSVTYPGDLKTPGAGEHYVPQPIFQTRKLTTSQGVPVGRRVLVGTLNPPASDGVSDQAGAGRVFLVFLRVTPNEP